MNRLPALFRQITERPHSALAVSAAVSLFILTCDNASFWRNAAAAANGMGGKLFMVSLFLCLFLIFTVCLSLFAYRFVFKPVSMLLLLGASLAGHFMDSYGIVIDKGMIGNLLETDYQEAVELQNLTLAVHLFFFGVLPCITLWMVRIRYSAPVQTARASFFWFTLAVFIVFVIAAPFSKHYIAFARNHREARHLLNPTNFLYAFAALVRLPRSAGDAAVQIGGDAKLRSTWQERGKKSALIVVVGETARAANFSLNDYQRVTNPRLSREQIINFRNFYSCDTATATSLPCLFSNLGRKSFTRTKARNRENILDVAARAGISVLWRENNSGCKGVCARVETHELAQSDDPRFCSGGECRDGILLHELQDYLNKARTDVLIVLHQKGSHGPAYYRRYPAEFELFKPACTNPELAECSQQEVVNAYDNSILYTDFFLSHVIALLRKNSGVYNAAMLYVSDHGESLGEHNLYLHGLPYWLAPDNQTHIPFLLWLSDGFKTAHSIDASCLQTKTRLRFSHDNIFHSILGMLDVATADYDPLLDILSGCGIPSTVAQEAATSVNLIPGSRS